MTLEFKQIFYEPKPKKKTNWKYVRYVLSGIFAYGIIKSSFLPNTPERNFLLWFCIIGLIIMSIFHLRDWRNKNGNM